jgi:general secretion pathway protein L
MMVGNITGIDIATGHIAAVQIASGLKGRRIRACTRVPLDGVGLEEGLGTLARTLDLKRHICRVTIPEEWVSFRNVPMPFTDPKKVRQALPFEVESRLPYPVEDLLIDFVMTPGDAGGGVLAASVRKDDLSGFLGLLRSHGIDPEVVEVRGSPLASWLLDREGVPDNFLVLDVEDDRHTLVLCLRRRIALIRSLSTVPPQTGFLGPRDERAIARTDPAGADIDPFFRSLCAAMRHTVHAFLARAGMEERPERLFFTGARAQAPLCADILGRLLDMPAEPIDVSLDRRVGMEGDMVGEWSPAVMSGALALALRNGRRASGFNLRRDEFGLERRYPAIRKAVPKAAVLIFLIMAFAAADIIVDTYLLKKEVDALDRQIAAIFQKTLPQATRMVDPVQQLRVGVEELKRSVVIRPAGGPEDTVVELLREISTRIPPSVRVQIQRMLVDPETVRISGRTDAFNEVDRIKNDLGTSSRFGAVSITSANLERGGSKVQFEILIERRR